MAADSGPDLSRLTIDRAPSAGSSAGGGCARWLVVLLLLAFGGYVAWKEGLLARWIPALQADDRPLVQLGAVVRRGAVPASSGVAANGYVVARRQAALSTDIQGRIVQLEVEEGDRVVEGQLIARLDTRQLEASRDQAAAELERRLADLDLARREFARLEPLVAAGDAQVSQLDEARATRDGAQAAVANQRATLDEIDVMLDKSSVYAPFDGVITAKNAEVGEVVAALGASGPNARGAVATLVDFDTLEVQIELAQSALSGVRDGVGVTVYLDAWPRDGFRGRVRQIWPTANRTKATVELRVEFLERDDRILPEMGVRAVFDDPQAERDAADDDEPDVLLPARALLDDGEERAVFVYRAAEGLVRRQVVTLDGEPAGGQVAVAEGLVGGEQVVIDPPPGLADGQAVRTGEG